jgi:hypothetical protein
MLLLALPFWAAFLLREGNAAPVACAPGTMAQYQDLGPDGCLLDDKIFAGFSFSSIITTPPDANQVLVTPIDTPLNPGFMFTGTVPFMGAAPAVRWLTHLPLPSKFE